ncbi:hypothetical protein ACFYUV_31150 [Nonomuraea sp. NPDC003560]|uniref:hypothetical protein n=1 Tax=Nonomuraea sp. NPDC003560 TaxID=3364341 RepID=UPI0036B1B5DE
MGDGGGRDRLFALALGGFQSAGQVGEFAAQPFGLAQGRGSGLVGEGAGLLGQSGGGDRLLAPLTFGGQRLAQPVGLFRVRCGGAASLVAFLLDPSSLGFLLLAVPAEVGEFVLLVGDLAFKVRDTGGRGGVHLGEFGGSAESDVTVLLGLVLSGGGFGGELLSLRTCVPVFADLAPGVLLAFLGAVAGSLRLPLRLFGRRDPGGGGVGRRRGALICRIGTLVGRCGGGPGLLGCLLRGLDLRQRAAAQLGQLGAQCRLSSLPLLAGSQQRAEEILRSQERVRHRCGV